MLLRESTSFLVQVVVVATRYTSKYVPVGIMTMCFTHGAWFYLLLFFSLLLSLASTLLCFSSQLHTCLKPAYLCMWLDVTLADASSKAGQVPVAPSFTNVNLGCGDGLEESGVENVSTSSSPYYPCCKGTTCMGGDLGVYCQCYLQTSNSKEVRTQHINGECLRCLFCRSRVRFPVCFPEPLFGSGGGDKGQSFRVAITPSSLLYRHVGWKMLSLLCWEPPSPYYRTRTICRVSTWDSRIVMLSRLFEILIGTNATTLTHTFSRNLPLTPIGASPLHIHKALTDMKIGSQNNVLYMSFR